MPGTDPGFTVGGGANRRRRGCQLTILPKFPKISIEKILGRGGRGATDPIDAMLKYDANVDTSVNETFLFNLEFNNKYVYVNIYSIIL